MERGDIDPLLKLFNDLDRELNADDVKEIKSLLIGKQLDRKHEDDMRDASDIFLYLRQRGIISESNLDLLISLFDLIQRPTLKEKIRWFLKERGFAETPKDKRQKRQLSSLDDEDSASIDCRRTAAKCEEHLRNHYESRMKWIEPVPYYEGGFQLDLIDVYVNLELVERNKRGKELSGVDFRQSLSAPKPPYRVLVEGEPGIGKSTFCRKLALDWATKTEKMLERYRLLILLELRQMVTRGGLIDAIYDQLLPESSGVNERDLEKFLAENPKDIIVVLDGADEAQTPVKEDVMKIISRKLHPMCTVIITSRNIERKRIVGFVDQHYIIKGFSAENTLLYINRYFDEDKLAASELCNKVESNENLKALAMNPLNTTLLCILWEDNSCIPSQLSQLYLQLVMSIFKRFCQKNGKVVPEDDQLPSEYKEKFHRLAKMGHDCLVKGILRFGSKELEEFGISENCDLLQLGLLNKEYSSAKLQACKFWVFLHKTFQEFLAAYYLHETGQLSDRNVLVRVVSDEQLSTVCLFTAGLLGNHGEGLFDAFRQALMSEGSSNTEHHSNVIHSAFSCLHESGNRHTFASKIVPVTIKHNALTFYNAICTSSFISGLAAIIKESKAMSMTHESLVIKELEFIRPTTYVSPVHGSELFDVLRNLGTLRKFSFMIANAIENKVAKVIDGNPHLEEFRLTVFVDQTRSLLPNVCASMQNLTNFKCLTILINELDRSANITEFLRSNPMKTALHLNGSLEYFELHGFHHAELLFLEIAHQIYQHGCLSALRLGFLSNGMIVERRQELTKIFRRNNRISKFFYYTEAISESDASSNNVEGTPTVRDNLTGGTRWENTSAPGYNEKVLGITKEFYEAMTKSEILRYVIVKHFGDNRDLKLLFEGLQSSINIRHLILIFENGPSDVNPLFALLESNQSIDLLAVLSTIDMGELSVPSRFKEHEVVSKVSDKVDAPILGKANFSLSSRWGVWLKRINSREKNIRDDKSAVDFYAKEQLLDHTLPYFKVAGWKVRAWERK
ncbi:uncharacterized protein [Ptychodera flava]|uniref:uncharacterized protein n=1 Tax=Ptychodera flava TaxID=63121 RepID=UPI00396A84D9